MISSLRGTVLSVTGGILALEVAGIGYSVNVTAEHALILRPGGEARVHTALIVREDALTLFGFETVEQLEVFDLLTSVTGVGPKSALGVLSALGPAQIAAAVDAEDDAVFRRVSGIGPKTAKLIVVSLAGKLAAHVATAQPTERSSLDTQVVVALVGLGWSERVAEQTVSEVLARQPSGVEPTVQGLLRLALAELGPAAAGGRS